MKKYYVYELINLMGTIEYVGETYRPNFRMYCHTKVKPSTTGKNREGKFYGRQDLIMNIVAEFDNRTDALALEGELKVRYGMYWGERDRTIKIIEKYSNPVLVYKKDGTFVNEYYSLRECARQLQLSKGLVSEVCNGLRKQTNGFVIKFKNDARQIYAN
jgi:predicted GIY-YIG superfamily endonuclease